MNTPDQRYARQIQYSPMGQSGQQRLATATVAVMGCGALGSVAAEILVRSGVGSVRLIDRDIVEWTNLQRQSLYDESDAAAGIAKSAAAAAHLRRINSTINIQPIVSDVVPSNIRTVLQGVDLVIDAVDNFLVRFLLNDWSLATGTPWVHGGAVGGGGQVRLFRGDTGPCFRCIVPTVPPAAAVETCDTAGVLGSVTHAIAAMQSGEALKWLSGNRDSVNESLLSIDFWNNKIRPIELPDSISQNCLACKHHRYEFLDGDAAASMETAAVLCGRDCVQLAGSGASDLAHFADRWQSLGEVNQTRFFVRLKVDDKQLTVFRDGRILVDGTDDITVAKSFAARYIGS